MCCYPCDKHCLKKEHLGTLFHAHPHMLGFVAKHVLSSRSLSKWHMEKIRKEVFPLGEFLFLVACVWHVKLPKTKIKLIRILKEWWNKTFGACISSPYSVAQVHTPLSFCNKRQGGVLTSCCLERELVINQTGQGCSLICCLQEI